MARGSEAERDLQTKTKLAVESYFSETYVEAREKFRWSAAALGAELDVRLEALKVKEPDYTIDVAVVKGSSSGGLAVHSSGVHGIEGFAGSAIQTAAMHEMLCSGIRPEVTTVFVHAINPFGMAHHRRWNENNVDLNRNALTEEGFKEVLDRDPNIAGYEDFEDLMIAKSAPSKWFVYVGVWFKTIYLIARYGMRHLKRAMVTSTYHHQQGIFFGGRELQPSHHLLGAFLSKNFGDVPSSEVVWIDVHTGLGPKGKDVLLVNKDGKASVVQAFPGGEVQCGDDADSSQGSQAAGYELVRGYISSYYGRFFKGGASATGRSAALIATQEFGTLPGILMARAMVIENRGYHFDADNRDYWSTYTRDCFYVRESAWKASILERGSTVFHQMLKFGATRAGMSATAPKPAA